MKKEDDGLTIYGVAEKDQGDYTCVASTELDKDSAKAYLTVLGKAVLPVLSVLHLHCRRLISHRKVDLWARGCPLKQR